MVELSLRNAGDPFHFPIDKEQRPMNTLLRPLLACTALLFTIAVSPHALAQSYPSKPIRIVVPYQAGDLSDVIARLIGQKVSEQVGQPVIVDNRPGASGIVGLQVALQAEPDGYTFVLGQMGSMAVSPNLNKPNFDIRADFIPVASMFSNDLMLVSNLDFGPKTLPELVAYSKANPGKVRLATNGEGGFPHLSMELLKDRTGMDFLHIPYKGNAQIPADVMGGRIELTILGFTSLLQNVKAGKMKPIAMTGKKRSPTAPDIPAFNETVSGYEALGWFGLFARKGTPPDIVTRINVAVNNALKMPDIAQKAESLGLDISVGSPQYFEAIWAQDFAKWGDLIRKLGLDKQK